MRWGLSVVLRQQRLGFRPGGVQEDHLSVQPGVGLHLPLDQCRSLFLCTDGLAQCVGFGLAADVADLHRRALEQGMPALADALWARQGADPDLERLPRFKLRDDATGALCRLG